MSKDLAAGNGIGVFKMKTLRAVQYVLGMTRNDSGCWETQGGRGMGGGGNL